MCCCADEVSGAEKKVEDRGSLGIEFFQHVTAMVYYQDHPRGVLRISLSGVG